MLTREHLISLCRPSKPTEGYLQALTDPEWGTGMMQRHGIMANTARLAGFLANGLHETGGLMVEAESLKYKTAARLRQVWPSRFRDKSDAELAPLLWHTTNNPDGDKHLAAAVYNGRKPDGSDRMGNRPGTFDGYFFCGRGFLQCTGRDFYLTHGAQIGIDFAASPELVQDMRVMFALSCLEWWQAGCNELCDAGNFDGACAAINTGSAKRIAQCVGLDDRRKWHGKVLAWIDQNPDAYQGEPDTIHPDFDTAEHQGEPHWSEHELVGA